jgi:hypothetical protein
MSPSRFTQYRTQFFTLVAACAAAVTIAACAGDRALSPTPVPARGPSLTFACTATSCTDSATGAVATCVAGYCNAADKLTFRVNSRGFTSRTGDQRFWITNLPTGISSGNVHFAYFVNRCYPGGCTGSYLQDEGDGLTQIYLAVQTEDADIYVDVEAYVINGTKSGIQGGVLTHGTDPGAGSYDCAQVASDYYPLTSTVTLTNGQQAMINQRRDACTANLVNKPMYYPTF